MQWDIHIKASESHYVHV